MTKKNEVELPKNTNGFSLNNFFQGTKEELEKVVWPSRKQLVSESAAVLLMVTLSASLIYLVDGLFGWAASTGVLMTSATDEPRNSTLQSEELGETDASKKHAGMRCK